MRSRSTLRVMGLLSFIALIGGGGAAQAAQAVKPILAGSETTEGTLFNTDSTPPDIASVPALSNLTKSGAKLYYLGERSGIHGWFIMQEGQIQMIYLSPDKKTVIVGAMFSSQGENVTTPQIAALAQTNKDISALLGNSGNEQKDVVAAGQEGGIASVPGAKGEISKSLNNMPSTPLSPGERLVQDMKAAAGVSLGKADAPELMMVVSPNCPNCKKTWAEMSGAVKEGKIQVRLIPVYTSTASDEKRAAAQLLKVQDPMAAWESYVGGNAAALAGTPDDVANRAIQANMSLIAKWNIQGTPYLVYRGKDGRVKIVQGKPERMAAILLDLSK